MWRCRLQMCVFCADRQCPFTARPVSSTNATATASRYWLGAGARTRCVVCCSTCSHHHFFPSYFRMPSLQCMKFGYGIHSMQSNPVLRHTIYVWHKGSSQSSQKRSHDMSRRACSASIPYCAVALGELRPSKSRWKRTQNQFSEWKTIKLQNRVRRAGPCSANAFRWENDWRIVASNALGIPNMCTPRGQLFTSSRCRSQQMITHGMDPPVCVLYVI